MPGIAVVPVRHDGVDAVVAAVELDTTRCRIRWASAREPCVPEIPDSGVNATRELVFKKSRRVNIVVLFQESVPGETPIVQPTALQIKAEGDSQAREPAVCFASRTKLLPKQKPGIEIEDRVSARSTPAGGRAAASKGAGRRLRPLQGPRRSWSCSPGSGH